MTKTLKSSVPLIIKSGGIRSRPDITKDLKKMTRKYLKGASTISAPYKMILNSDTYGYLRKSKYVDGRWHPTVEYREIFIGQHSIISNKIFWDGGGRLSIELNAIILEFYSDIDKKAYLSFNQMEVLEILNSEDLKIKYTNPIFRKDNVKRPYYILSEFPDDYVNHVSRINLSTFRALVKFKALKREKESGLYVLAKKYRRPKLGRITNDNLLDIFARKEEEGDYTF